MCIAVPVQVVETGEFVARCRGLNGEEQVNMLLLDKLTAPARLASRVWA